ncbi:MAG: succinylglutamate desuccinylase/aspartoacylase family protein [Thaumarchaeota archaeon]|nr:succinylglutamate desuccinylase/aspartoacylase family protein [Nitrososphaerota archaeon]
MPGKLSIIGVTCDTGEKKYQEVTIDSSNSMNVVLPVMLVNGKHEGPTLCITAGMYGDEYPGIEAAIRTFHKIAAERLHGNLVILPVLNTSTFQWRTVGPSPIDRKDLNRVFPGNSKGTITEQLAYTIFNGVIKSVDFHVDLRGGDTLESHMTHMIMCRTGNPELDNESFRAAKSFGLEFIMIHDAGKEGAMPGILLQEATKIGKPSIISEIGIGLATYLEEDIALTERGIEGLMKHLHLLSGSPENVPSKISIMRDGARVVCSQGGIFYPIVQQTGPYFTQLLSKGQKVGEIRNIRGDVLEELQSPVSGVLHELLPRRVVSSGDTVILLRTIEESSKYFKD